MSVIDKIIELKIMRQEFSLENIAKAHKIGKLKEYLKAKKNIDILNDAKLKVVDNNIVVVSDEYRHQRVDVLNKQNDSISTIDIRQRDEEEPHAGFRVRIKYHLKNIPALSKVSLTLNGEEQASETFNKYFGFDDRGLLELSENIKDPKLKEAFDKFVCYSGDAPSSQQTKNNSAQETNEVSQPLIDRIANKRSR